jgi:hypothetical protein
MAPIVILQVLLTEGVVMKSFAKVLLVGAVAVMAIAISAAPSEAAKKKRMKGPAPGTYVGQVCSTKCNAANACSVMAWTSDKRWISAVITPACVKPFCPAAC